MAGGRTLLLLVLFAAGALGQSCGPVPTTPFGTFTACTTVNSATTCALVCAQGYETQGGSSITCGAGASAWTGNPTCVANPCLLNPCNALTSACTVLNSPPFRVCSCLPGYEGDASNDGSECLLPPTMTSENGTLVLRVGGNRDISFLAGPTATSLSSTVATLASLVAASSQTSTAVVQLAQNTAAAQMSLAAQASSQAAQVAAGPLASTTLSVAVLANQTTVSVMGLQQAVASLNSSAISSNAALSTGITAAASATLLNAQSATNTASSSAIATALSATASASRATLSSAVTAINTAASQTLSSAVNSAANAANAALSLAIANTNSASAVTLSSALAALNSASLVSFNSAVAAASNAAAAALSSAIQNTNAQTQQALLAALTSVQNGTTLPGIQTQVTLPTCTAGTLGRQRYNTVQRTLQVCMDYGWGAVAGLPALGSSALNPINSCADLVTAPIATPSNGLYFMRLPSNTSAIVQVYCIVAPPATPRLLSYDGSASTQPAFSCRVLRDLFGKSISQSYFLSTVDGPIRAFCDMVRNGGGWTQLVAVRGGGWGIAEVLLKGNTNAFTSDTQFSTTDFSILKYANAIKNDPFISGARMQVRMEALAPGTWGGVWNTDRRYSLTSAFNSNTDFVLETQFTSFTYPADNGLEARLPYLGAAPGLLTTSWNSVSNWYGTLITSQTTWFPSPWIQFQMSAPTTIWYWMREGPATGAFDYNDYGSETSPAPSCQAVATNLPGAVNGVYFINPGTGTQRKFCIIGGGVGRELCGDGSSSTNPTLSCRVLYDKFQITHSANFWLRPNNTGTAFQTYCDMNTAGGGWTLLVTTNTISGWTSTNVLLRGTASITADFSVLTYADSIKNAEAFNINSNFQYRLDAGTFGAWGGVWTAPATYSFVMTANNQTNVGLPSPIFSDWVYSDTGIEQRMPWLYTGFSCPGAYSLLTTSALPCTNFWGTVVSGVNGTSSWNPSPWIDCCVPGATSGSGLQPNPGIIWYWLREGPSKY